MNFKTLAAAIALTGASGLASAASYCVPGPNADGLDVSDITLNGLDASDCYGVVDGNDDLTEINNLNWGDFDIAVKDDNPGSGTNGTGTLQGLEITLAADAGGSGNWSLTIVDTNGATPLNLPAFLDIVAVVKGSTKYAAYFFDDIEVDGSNDGTFSIQFTNRGGNTPDLSHLTAYIRAGEGDCAPTDPNCNPNEVPAPGTLALLGGLLFGGAALRRRREQ